MSVQLLRSSLLALSLAMLACVITVRVPNALAEPWTAKYKGGGEISVDQRTNHATIKRNGVESQLWDGVHQLDNGGTITTRAGQAVPNREMLNSRRQPPPPEVIKRSPDEMWMGPPIIGRSPCEKLVSRVCGIEPACAEKEACSMSRQLLEFEHEERAASRIHNRMTRASGECQQAELDNSYFTSCSR